MVGGIGPVRCASSGGPRKSVVVTGASRGLGFELARHLLRYGFDVVGWCRKPAPDVERLLTDASRGGVVDVDFNRPQTIPAAARRTREILGESVDLLVNNAAIGFPAGGRGAAEGPLSALRAQALLEVLCVNAVAPALVTQALAPLLAEGGLVVNVTSDLGSLSGVASAGSYGYAMSKAALNMLTRKLAAELRQHGTTVVAVHPGSMRTRLGGASAELDPETAAAQLITLFARLGPGSSGLLFSPDGARIAW